MSDKIKGQTYKSEFNSSFGYSEDLRFLYRNAAEMRVRAGMGQLFLVGGLIADLGAAVSILRMATTNPEAKEDLRDRYAKLRKALRSEVRHIERGKNNFNYAILDECELFQDFLMQQTQNVGLGFSLQRQMGKRELKSL